MALTFEIGDAGKPRGHAILYYGSPGGDITATYVLVLPISMDMGKYLPPLLASQLGAMAGSAMGEGLGSFAAPPVPEAVESVAYLERLAGLRGDDLIWGGNVALGDMAAAMQEAAEAVQEYARLYGVYVDSGEALAPERASEHDKMGEMPGSSVQEVLYGLMSERNRLGELSKLVGTMRFASDREDAGLVEETDASLGALQRLLPEHYWADKVRSAAQDTSDNGAQLAQLYVERCYKLLDEDFSAVEELERRIAELEA